eukprot:1154203-Pelagomonas_calceolata.AAC.11
MLGAVSELLELCKGVGATVVWLTGFTLQGRPGLVTVRFRGGFGWAANDPPSSLLLDAATPGLSNHLVCHLTLNPELPPSATTDATTRCSTLTCYHSLLPPVLNPNLQLGTTTRCSNPM